MLLLFSFICLHHNLTIVCLQSFVHSLSIFFAKMFSMKSISSLVMCVSFRNRKVCFQSPYYLFQIAMGIVYLNFDLSFSNCWIFQVMERKWKRSSKKWVLLLTSDHGDESQVEVIANLLGSRCSLEGNVFAVSNEIHIGTLFIISHLLLF